MLNVYNRGISLPHVEARRSTLSASHFPDHTHLKRRQGTCFHFRDLAKTLASIRLQRVIDSQSSLSSDLLKLHKRNLIKALAFTSYLNNVHSTPWPESRGSGGYKTLPQPLTQGDSGLLSERRLQAMLSWDVNLVKEHLQRSLNNAIYRDYVINANLCLTRQQLNDSFIQRLFAIELLKRTLSVIRKQLTATTVKLYKVISRLKNQIKTSLIETKLTRIERER